MPPAPAKKAPPKAAAKKATTPAAPKQRAAPPAPVTDVEKVWQAAPPLGKPAAVTTAIADAAGLHYQVTLFHLNKLADGGRAQRLTKDGVHGYVWRRL